jgi:hypothetical protein
VRKVEVALWVPRILYRFCTEDLLLGAFKRAAEVATAVDNSIGCAASAGYSFAERFERELFGSAKSLSGFSNRVYGGGTVRFFAGFVDYKLLRLFRWYRLDTTTFWLDSG